MSIRISGLLAIGLLASLACVQHAGAQGDERVDQAAVERLVWRIAWGVQSRDDADAFLGRDLLTEEFFRVGGGPPRLIRGDELARIPAVAPAIDEDDLRRVSLKYLHVSVFGLAAIATASTDGEAETFAIMCVETREGWKIAALQAR